MKSIRLMSLAGTLGVLLAGGLLLGACDEQGSAEKAGQEAGKKIDKAIEQTRDGIDTAKEDAARLLESAGQKAKDAADQIRQGSRDFVEEAERKADEATKPDDAGQPSTGNSGAR